MAAILLLFKSVFLFSVNIFVFLDIGFFKNNGFYSFQEFYFIHNILYIQIEIKFLVAFSNKAK